MSRSSRIAAEERAKAEAAAKRATSFSESKAEIAEKQKQEKASKPAEPVANNNSKVQPTKPAQPEPPSKPTAGGKEIYVEATAYTADPAKMVMHQVNKYFLHGDTITNCKPRNEINCCRSKCYSIR